MGGSSWSTSAYSARAAAHAAAGTSAFTHHAAAASAASRGGTAKAHDRLDPKQIKNGKREARDSEAHPTSNAVIISLDVTGSMSTVPTMIQKALPALMGLLTRNDYLTDPAICMSAFGDTACDAVPFQVGQFESGIEIDDDISAVYMEGGGGGNRVESPDISLFFAARMTSCDAFEKRNKKGYLFIITDEDLPSTLTTEAVEKVFGSKMGLQGNTPIGDIVAEAKQKWEIFLIIPNMTGHYLDESYRKEWRKHLDPQNIIMLQDPNGIAETIATTIGLAEGNASHDSLVEDLTAAGTSADTAQSVVRALATVSASGGGAISKLSGGATGLTSL